MQERVRCPRCWKRVPGWARFCRRCGYGLRRVGPPAAAGRCTAVPLLVWGIMLAGGLMSVGRLVSNCALSAPAMTHVRAAPPSPAPAPYAQWARPRHHRVTPQPDAVRWPAIPEQDPVVLPEAPRLPPPYRTRYVSPARPRPANPYLYNNGRPAEPYVYPSPDVQNQQR